MPDEILLPSAGSRIVTPPVAEPVYVDLEGSLLRTSLVWEAVILLLTRNVFYIFLIAAWRLKGSAYLKERLASKVSIDPRALPYNERFLCRLRTSLHEGRQLVLISSVDRKWAEPIARYTGLFSGVVTSDSARGVERECPEPVDEVASNSPIKRLKVILKAIRVHQWVKNALILLPVLTSHRFNDAALMTMAGLAIVAFSFCASSVYIINDLLDLPNDRRHATKRRRPFAAGDLSIPAGLALLAGLLISSALITLSLPRGFQLLLAFYFALTLAYSLSLKRKMLVDIFTLGGLYTLRVLAGSAATRIEPSPWLLAFCLFFFLSLALVKRFTELREMKEEGSRTIAGRGYSGVDLQAIGSLGTSSGFMCVLVLALYINSPQVIPLYRYPFVLWFLCPLILYWISRVWLMAYRGTMNEDPVLFALRDRVSYLTAVCCAIVLSLAARGIPVLRR